jgi:hypothetical protein
MFSVLTIGIFLVLLTSCSQVSTVTLSPHTVTVPVTTVVIPASTITITQTITNTVNATSAPANTNSSNITVTALSTPQMTTIQSWKIVVLQNTTNKLQLGFNFFDENGNGVNFQNANFTVSMGISAQQWNAATQSAVSINILTAGIDTDVEPGARTTITAPTLVNSGDTITIPRTILNLQGVTNNNVQIDVGLIGKSNPPLQASPTSFLTIQLAQ